MRLLLALLLALLVILQYKLWFGDGGLRDVRDLERDLSERVAENAGLQARNRALEAEVRDLKTGLDAYEERARLEMGMIRDGETFFRIVEDRPDRSEDTETPLGGVAGD